MALVLLALGQVSASAQILISNFSMSRNSVSFDISGNFPGEPPTIWGGFINRNALYFTNPDLYAEPGFTITSGFNISSTASFTGPQPLTLDSTGTGNDIYGDYFYVAFNLYTGFGYGQAVSGSFAATWNNPAFNPNAVSSLNVFWGNDGWPTFGVPPILSPATGIPPYATSGAFLTSVVVPEPSTYALLLMTGAGALWWAKRRR